MTEQHCPNAEEFLNGLPDNDAEEIEEMICLTMIGDEPSSDKISVSIMDSGHINISNMEANGYIEYNDVEYSFTARSGDNNGFEIIAFDEEYEPYIHRDEAMPIEAYNCQQSMAGAVLRRWDALKTDASVIDILSEYGSCRYTNSSTSKPVANLTRKHLEIVDGDTADFYRNKLKKLYAMELLTND